MIGIIENVRRGLVNGNGAGLGGRVGRLAAMNGQRADSLLGLVAFGWTFKFSSKSLSQNWEMDWRSDEKI